MNKKIAGASAAIALLALQGACAPTAHVVGRGGPTIEQARSESATGGKLRVAVMKFDNRTRYDVGQGMGAMLTSALFEAGRFIVLEREELSDVLFEQRLGATGVVGAETAVPSGEVEGAEILVYGTVTIFEPGQRGAVSTVGGAQQSQVAIDLKLVDARTARVLATTTVNGRASDVSVSTEGLKYAGLSPLFFMEGWSNTPIEGAIRLCIEEGVDYLVSTLDSSSQEG